MRCHIEKIEGFEKVLIPGCMAVAVPGDIERCTCHPTTIRQFETPKYKEHVKELEKTIRSLEKENEYCRELLIKNKIKL